MRRKTGVNRISERRAEIEIRAATPEDWTDLLALMRAYYRFDAIRFRAAIVGPALKRLLEDKSVGRAWIARDRGTQVGYVMLTFNYDAEFGGIEGIVTDLFIASAYRGVGLGRRVMAIVEDYCRAAGMRAIELQVKRDNRTAQAFYRHLGFRKLSRLVMSRLFE
jgi:ribosomal protein S18 acetylase RimI-like enzyme